MNVERVGIHESVGSVFPPEKLRGALADLSPAVAIVGDDPADLEACDGVVTFEHRDAFLETVAWVHSIQAGVKRTVEPVERVETVHPPEDLRTAVEEARFVALAVPLTDETRHLVGRAELDAMRDDAYLINAARGQVVDERALIEALRGGDIAGAALDVFAAEPLPDDSPLWDLENVIVTPTSPGASGATTRTSPASSARTSTGSWPTGR